MKQITKSFYTVETAHGWTIYGVTRAGYPFTIAGACGGFLTSRDARLFVVRWLRDCEKADVCPSSVLGRGIARYYRHTYQLWLDSRKAKAA